MIIDTDKKLENIVQTLKNTKEIAVDTEFYWMRTIKRFFNCEVNNIFDTQLTASFLGTQSQISLKALLKDILDIEMEKESQFSDWRKRPLSQKQFDYALKDVEHLIEVKHHLEEKLNQTDYKRYFYEELLEIQKNRI